MTIKDECIFTEDELKTWVESVGGVETRIAIPPDHFWIRGALFGSGSKILNKHTYGVIRRIETIQSKYWAVIFNFGDSLLYGLVWPGMRIARPKIIVNPYPHICKICRAPSRRCIGFTLCSNASCKSRSTFTKALSIKRVPKKELGNTCDHPIIPMCPICGNDRCGLGKEGLLLCPRHGLTYYTFQVGKWYHGWSFTAQYIGIKDHIWKWK